MIERIVTTLNRAMDQAFPEDAGPFRAATPYVAAVLSVAIGLGFLFRLPVLSLEPGAATNMLEKLTATNREASRSRGQLLLTTANVSIGTLTVWEAIEALADDAAEIVPRRFYYQADCTTPEEDRSNSLADIEHSKLKAELAAFRELKLPVRKIEGGRVLRVFEDGPSDRKLRARDVIIAVDGKPTRSHAEVSNALTKPVYEGEKVRYERKPGAVVRVRVRRGSVDHDFSIKTRPSGGCEPNRPVIGIALGEAYRLPIDLDIDTALVGGPSGGLVFALSIIDAFSEQDLTRGHVVAVTGTIEFKRRFEDRQECVPDPRDPGCKPFVGRVGAVRHKVGSALSEGADVFIVPVDEVEEMRSVAPDSLKIYGVKTLQEALAVLRSLRPAR